MQLSTRFVRRACAAVAVVAVATIGVVADSSASSATPLKGKTLYFNIGGTDGHEVGVLHGAVTAGGRDDASHDNYDVLHLGNGTLRATHPDKDATLKQHLNRHTCYISFTLKGTLTVGHGTGKYAHVHGAGTYTGVGHGILARSKSGACSFEKAPKAEVFTVHGSATLK